MAITAMLRQRFGGEPTLTIFCIKRMSDYVVRMSFLVMDQEAKHGPGKWSWVGNPCVTTFFEI
jgi:hypothetical protein